MAVSPEHLAGIYAAGPDPWGFRTSPYEARRFKAILGALRPSYASVLEIGCGNGELARRLAPRAGTYAGLDAVETALAAAREAAPMARFVQGFVPCELPEGAHDLVVVSEILYFLDPAGIDALAAQIDARWPGAQVAAVNWLGPTGNPLQGAEALALFAAALSSARPHRTAHEEADFRIDLWDGQRGEGLAPAVGIEPTTN